MAEESLVEASRCSIEVHIYTRLMMQECLWLLDYNEMERRLPLHFCCQWRCQFCTFFNSKTEKNISKVKTKYTRKVRGTVKTGRK